ncbi:MAG TPA: hypothetical protein VH134_13995 [Candidatus Dormibacteraeota bacterium]|nr:hypothetical protein [Candidatus Dormibacteraeota bacterium]
MAGRWRGIAGLLALGVALGVAAPALAATAPTPAAAPTHRPVRASPRAAATATPAATPTPGPTPGDAASAGRRRLRAIESVDEGFLLGLPGAGPKGPLAYVPPEPRSSAGDTAGLLFAGAAGLLVAVGSGAVVLFLVLRPRRAPATPPARASVALPPGHRGWLPARRRRTTRLSQEAFERLPPLVQLALLDRIGSGSEPGEEATATAPPPAG